MSKAFSSAVIGSVAFVWLGMIIAISFLEAWLKFQAPGITLPLGLGIGRLVFAALNRVEWGCAFIIIAAICTFRSFTIFRRYFFFVIALALLIAQSVWLLPALDARAELYIQHKDVPASSLHFYYTGMELVKVISLLCTGIAAWKSVVNIQKY